MNKFKNQICTSMERINIAELLKDCPKGMELYSPLCGECKFFSIVNDVIYVESPLNKTLCFNSLGMFFEWCEESECLLFPSKDQRDWSKFEPPYEFKDGDVLVHTQNERFIMSIYKSNETEIIINTHVIFWDREEGLSVGMQICCYTDNVRFATKEEKAKLFQVIKDNGYKWNEETKTLEKLTPNKFDITTLKPFDKVLVRDNNEQFWTCDWFSFHDTKQVYPFACVGHYVSQCIPYEENQHLLGTTNDCDNFYKTWE